jgi:hypothetical protein
MPVQALGHVNVHTVAQEAGGISVTPAVREMPTRNTCLLPCRSYHLVDGPRADPAAKLRVVVGAGVDEDKRRGGQRWSYDVEIMPEHGSEHGGRGIKRGF